MTPLDLKGIYGDYLDCLNARRWRDLENYVRPDVEHNGQRIGLGGYREMLEEDVRSIPDLFFKAAHLIAEPPFIAARLNFECHPVGTLFGLRVDGKLVRFQENVFYEFTGSLIHKVHSVIDKTGITGQI
jgi:predicted ester cyclase